MITIICASDRTESYTSKVAGYYRQLVIDQGLSPGYFSLENLPADFFQTGQYGISPAGFTQVLNRDIGPADHIIFVVPEYNGSYPGYFKYFIDILPPLIWEGKKAAIVGVATGRAGNLRGADHLVAVFHYLKMEVFSQKPLFSSIHHHFDAAGKLTNEEYKLNALNQVKSFLQF